MPGIDNLKIPATTMTSYTTAKYEELIPYGSVITCTFYAYQGDLKSTGSMSADLALVSNIAVVNGKCGDADDDDFSSAPAADLCSSGTVSSVSGSGPWYWSCAGSNGGTTVSCSANKKSSSTATATTTVIPVTEYTYSYTSKVAPASGTATNVALLLSVSAVITLGVWLAMKKIKG